MEFDKNNTEFPTMLHRDIYMTALRMTPPEISLAEIDKTDPDLAKSGCEFYSFMIELLSDMYNDPHLYGMTPGAYEEFINWGKYHAVKRYQPKNALLFFDQSGAELSSYLDFLKEIAIRCKIDNRSCILSANDFEQIKKYSFLPTRKRERAIPIETVIEMFKKMGLIFQRNDDGCITVINKKYSNMFKSMSALAKAADNSIKNPVSKSAKYYYVVNYDYLEFRQIFKNYWPDYNDVTRFLPDDDCTMVKDLHMIAKEYNMSETYSYYGGYASINFQYKSKPIMHIWLDNTSKEPNRAQKKWIRYIIVSIRGSSRSEYLHKVECYGEDFVKYFRRHLNYCVCCNPDHVVGRSGIRQILGKNVRICSDPGGIIKKPTPEDLPYIKKYIDLRIEEILAGVK
jgi:hypothetical protein